MESRTKPRDETQIIAMKIIRIKEMNKFSQPKQQRVMNGC
jgi:hypothetical protein